MTFSADYLRPSSAHADCPEPDLVLFSHNRLIAASLEHFLLAQFPSRRVMKVCTADAVENIIRASHDARLIAVLPEGGIDALAQFRTIMPLQRYSQLKLMVLASAASKGLQPLLASARWLSLRSSTEQLFREIQIWLRSPAPSHSSPSLSELTPRQYLVLCMLAHGLSLPEVASSLGISVKTVVTHRFDIRTRLGMSCRADWLLLCAAVRECLNYPNSDGMTNFRLGYLYAEENY
ncbi:helix-turn-helix transcriptional regulator [Cronobacter turicensis]|nr:helix-turn-helix transcriptional regulator [Cronobacter turicensis]